MCTFVFVFVCVCACVFIHACAHLTHSSHYVYVVSTLEHQRLRVFVHARVQLTFPDMHALFYSVTSETLCVRSFMHTDNFDIHVHCFYSVTAETLCVCSFMHALNLLTVHNIRVWFLLWNTRDCMTPSGSTYCVDYDCASVCHTALVCDTKCLVLYFKLMALRHCRLYVQYIMNMLGSMYRAFSTP